MIFRTHTASVKLISAATRMGVVMALCLGTSVAYAEHPGGILQLDSDGDGVVSREEFRPPERRRGPGLFERADLDGDGSVTRDEVGLAIDEGAEERQERMRTHMLRMFDEMDENGNGVVTEEEARDHAFARVDADGDGFVTEAEAEALREERRGKREQRRNGNS